MPTCSRFAPSSILILTLSLLLISSTLVNCLAIGLSLPLHDPNLASARNVSESAVNSTAADASGESPITVSNSSSRRILGDDSGIRDQWKINSCFQKTRPLQRVLSKLKQNIPEVQADIKQGRKFEAFTAIFKDNSNTNIKYITDIFQASISQTTPLYRGHSSSREPGRPLNFECITNRDRTPDDYDACEQNAAYAFYDYDEDPYSIKLCNRFFTALIEAPSKEWCPRPHPITGKYRPAEQALTLNQEATLLHELIHIYLPANQLGGVMRDKQTGQIVPIEGAKSEAQSAPASLALTSSEAVKNAESYALYFSCGSRLFFSPVVFLETDSHILIGVASMIASIAKCPKWPLPNENDLRR